MAERSGAALGTARVRLLGGPVVEGVGDHELASRKGRTVLKVLALARGQPVSVHRLAEILWGEEPPLRPSEQVGVLVSRLRAVLGAHRLPRLDAGYAFLADWLDLDELDARVAEASRALADGRLGAARAAAEAAASLARGPVLADDEGEWVEAERASAEALSAAARRIAAEAAARAGDHAAAAAHAELALAHDRYDEEALRILMRAHAAAGRPASALAAYARVRRCLAEDLGVSPTAATEQLHDRILLSDPEAGAEGEREPREQPRLPGREADLAALDAALERARLAPVPVTVVVEGEAGIGKTALLEAWTSRLPPAVLVLRGRGDELGRGLPLQPIADAIAGQLAGLAEAERHAALGPDGPVLRPLLGAHTGSASHDDASAGASGADVELGRAQLFAALLSVMERLTAGSLGVLVVDDLQVAGSSTLAWLRFVARRRTRLLILGAARPGTGPLTGATTTIRLGPLDVAAVAEVVGPERAGELHARSGGHPLLLAALAGSDDADLPTSLRDAVERRMESLGPAAPSIRTAAILGPAVNLDLLAEVLRTTAVAVLEHLELAAASGLLVERGAGFDFRHDLEREVLEASAGSARRALVHRQAARALAARPAPDPLAVAVHARLGGDAALAARWYQSGAEVAVSRFDLDAAEQHLDAAIELAATPEAYAARARVRMAALQLEGAAEDAARAVSGGGGAPALEVAAWVAYYRRRYDEAGAYADEGLARAATRPVRASCLSVGGRVRHGAGDLAGAVRRLEEATAEEAPTAGLASVWLAHARLHQGRPADALRLLQQALVDPGRLGHPFAPLHGRFGRVLALGQLGRADEALVASDELDAAVSRAGAVGMRFMGPAANCRAWILRWTGRTIEADEHNTAAVEATVGRHPMVEAHYAGLLDLADGRLLAGDLDGAGKLADRLSPIAGWSGTMAWHQRHRWGLLRARLALASGDPTTAVDLAAGVAADAGARGARRYELLAAAVSALAGGEPPVGTASLHAVVLELAACAALDGWPLVAALAARYDNGRWRTVAERCASAMVDTAPDQRAAQAFASRLLD